MKYPDHETYRALYAKYYDGRDIGELLDLLEPLKGTQVMELCAGDGRLAIEALRRGGAWALIVEQEQAMVPPSVRDRRNLDNIIVEIATVEDTLFKFPPQEIDRVVCRQAVNYWLNKPNIRLVARALKSGGIFVFNTFNEKPQKYPLVKEYEYDDHWFVEISWLVDDTVHHVQVRDGMEPHCTQFKWIPPDQFRSLLEPHFVVDEIRDGKASLYKCVRR